MIFVDRTKEDKPPILVNEAEKEHNLAHDFYFSAIYLSDPNKPGFDKFNAYSHKSVKDALERLFNQKCAYCETQVTVGHDIEKEHFRPKAMVIENSKELKPGYYWLSADWNNLFLSCDHCNQIRVEHETQYGTVLKLGKGNQFPLSIKRKVDFLSRFDSSDEPFRLLINPCIDDPEEYFMFDKNGSISPKPKLTGKKKKMAITSAMVFALIRIRLVKKRESHYLRVEILLKDIERRLRDYLLFQTSERKDELIEKLEEFEKLKDPKNPHNEYIAITRQLERQNKIKLLKALNALK
jgi:uncharacterized protein (TIGR02646 family)